MKIEILEPSGYCSGVKRAMELALKTRQNNPNSKIYVLGSLVHNSDALKGLKIANIESLENNEESINHLCKDAIVILTAHGHAKSIEKILKEKDIYFIDATCPFVQQALLIIEKSIKDNHEVIYIGKRNHPEAIAALSISNNVHLYEPDKDFDFSLVKDKSPLVISQTTFSEFEVENSFRIIKSKIPMALIHNGVCHASTKRQKALLTLSNDVDLIYVVGGKNSNNTKTLFNIAKNKYKNSKVLMIENKSEINKKDLLGLNYVVISSGASTPMSIILEIKSYIELLCN